VDPSEFIGGTIWATGVHDLAVSEAIWRVLRPADIAVDAGANIGYMMGIMALRVGRSGSVLAFEPHPGVFELLEHNSALLGKHRSTCSPTLYRLALSARNGHASLVTDSEWETNKGLAHLEESTSTPESAITVEMKRLDDIVGDEEIALLKLDVEGHEADVLMGASRLLAERKIKTVIYEEKAGIKGRSHEILADAGFALFCLDSRVSGALIAPLGTPRITPAPDFLATLDPDDLRARFAQRGWQLFGRAKLRAGT